MPVYKYRRVEDMEDRWYEPGDPRLFRAVRQIWQTADRLLRPRYPPGVHKLGSADDADALREAWEDANVEARRDRRAVP
jgi:hypothetical protein